MKLKNISSGWKIGDFFVSRFQSAARRIFRSQKSDFLNFLFIEKLIKDKIKKLSESSNPERSAFGGQGLETN